MYKTMFSRFINETSENGYLPCSSTPTMLHDDQMFVVKLWRWLKTIQLIGTTRSCPIGKSLNRQPGRQGPVLVTNAQRCPEQVIQVTKEKEKREKKLYTTSPLDIAGTLLVIAQRFEKLESGLLDAFVHWKSA
jgi:hypothetical protein